ncbi:hypothetical protein QSJ18_16895 [Gordonia sp. ABSL1-1]|uniref:hypothetical protein n=1 Tax=Gordonia sp. ABSL1-1 TaxID=3053923 RepID=UPI002572A1FF|nr:hypothetical protein [Gordonia sp. ABSL1-1]MDL9938429.1 hypothetical protein [Gordonia sp. ABSL1-1]
MADYLFRLRQRERVFRCNIQRAKSLATTARSMRSSDTECGDEDSSGADISRDLASFSVVAAVASIDELVKSIYCDTLCAYLKGEYEPLAVIKATIPVAAARAMMDAQARGDAVNIGLLSTLAQTAIFKENDRTNFQNSASISKALRSLGAPRLSECVKNYVGSHDVAKDTCTGFDKIAHCRHIVVHRLSVETLSVEGDTAASNSRAPLSADEAEIVENLGLAIVHSLADQATS